MNTILILLLVLYTTVYFISARKIQTRVYNGKPAKLKNFAFQASLYLKRRESSSAGFDCSGALISNSHILTAAHCFYPHGPMGEVHTAGEVVVGSTKKYAPFGEDAAVRKISSGDIFVHNGYTALEQNDIAIVLLQRPVNFKPGVIEPVRLPALNQGSLVGKIVTVAGWGFSNDRTQTESRILMYSRITVVDDSVCIGRFIGYKADRKKCAMGNQSGTCGGDSGAAFTITEDDGIKTIVGVVSGGVDFCEDGGPETMADVHHHLNWIYQMTGLPLRHV